MEKSKVNICDAIAMARNHASAVLSKAEREDDGSLFELGNNLLHGSASQIEKTCRQLVNSYEDACATHILLGFEL